MVQWESLDALSHQLELCKIDPGVSLVVVFGAATSADRVALVRAAVERTGAQAIEVRPMRTTRPEHDHRLLQAVVGAADLVITTATPDNSSVAALDGNHQLLYLHDIAPHCFGPNASLRRRVIALGNQLQAADALTLTDANGSELQIEVAAGVIDVDHGLVDADNPIASFPAGWVAITPARGRVNGQLVIMPGDADLGASRFVASPVVLHIVDDHIAAIDGDSPDADVLRALFEYPNQSTAYGMAELSVGMNPGAPITGAFDHRLLDPVVARLLAGVVTVSFGENLVADRPCSQKVTLALARRTVHIDGLPVLLAGRLDGDFAPDVYEL